MVKTFPSRFAFLSVLCGLCANLLLVSAYAAAPAKDPLQRFVERVDTLSAHFEQVQKDEQGAVTQTSSGQLWLARPGRFRWAYEKPYAQLMSSDGKTLWMYDPDLAQVTVRQAGPSLQGTPVQLLTDRVALDRQFKLEDLGADHGARKLRLTPRAPESDFKGVELWLTDGVPQRMNFQDQLGGSSEVSFSAIKLNPKLEDSLFVFRIPEGTEVIETPAAAPAPAHPSKK
jgi:outer membrane lipoprotein carrier protein